MTVLPNLAAEREAMLAEIAKLQAANAALRAKGDRAISCKVTDKGGVSVYGLGRFPVTLYLSQWEKLAKGMPTIMAFVEANRGLLAIKD